MLRVVKALMLAVIALSVTAPVMAAAPSAGGVKYVYLEPGFVVNYGEKGRMKYLKTDVALKIASDEAAAKIKSHLPYLRNDMILLLSSQNADTINSADAREDLRKQALDLVRGVLMKLEGQTYVDDLYFSNFVAQN